MIVEGEYVPQTTIQIKNIGLAEPGSFWYPMKSNCCVCQKPIAPSIKFTTCGDAECIRFRNALYCKSEEYKQYKWWYMKWYRTTDGYKARVNSDEFKAWARQYNKAYRQTDKYKAYCVLRKEQRTEEQKEHTRKYMREYMRTRRANAI